MKRITYKKGNNGILIAGPFESPYGQLGVNINQEGKYIIVKLPNTEMVECSSHSEPISLNKAKKLVREALKNLRVKIEDEVRPRLKN